MTDNALTELTADIVAAYVAENKLSVDDLKTFISSVYTTLTGLGAPEAEPEAETTKATPAQIKRSITPDGLISFIDGKRYKTLKRHLTTQGHTVESYRAAFGLPRDYPTTAPNYSKARSEMAKSLGLGVGGRGGGKRLAAPAPQAPAPAPAPARKPRATKAPAK